MQLSSDTRADAELVAAVRQVLADIAGADRAAEVDESTDLFVAGIIDSFGILQLIAGLEARLGVSITEEELVPQNLWSLAAITGTVKRLKASPAAQ